MGLTNVELWLQLLSQLHHLAGHWATAPRLPGLEKNPAAIVRKVCSVQLPGALQVPGPEGHRASHAANRPDLDPSAVCRRARILRTWSNKCAQGQQAAPVIDRSLSGATPPSVVSGLAGSRSGESAT